MPMSCENVQRVQTRTRCTRPIRPDHDQDARVVSQRQVSMAGIINTQKEQADTMKQLAGRQKDFEDEVKGLREKVDVEAVTRAPEKKADEIKAALNEGHAASSIPSRGCSRHAWTEAVNSTENPGPHEGLVVSRRTRPPQRRSRRSPDRRSERRCRFG